MNKTITVITKKSNTLDSSVGNSILRWAQAYYLNYKCNFEYTIILEHEFWSELNILEFPYTKLGNIDSSSSYHSIDYNLIKEVLLDNNIDNFIKHDHLILDEWYIFHNHKILNPTDNSFTDFEWNAENPLSFIKFKSEYIEKFFRSEFSNFVSIHIRRFNGIIIGPRQIASLPKRIAISFYEEYIKQSGTYHEGWKNTFENGKIKQDHQYYIHPFISDNQYYTVIDNLLDYDIDQKIYISTDIPKKYYQYYKERYRNIYDKYYYLKFFENIVKKYHGKNILNFDYDVNRLDVYYSKREHLVLGNILDIFAMCNSKLIVQSYLSSWGKVAREMRNTNQVILPLSVKNENCTHPQEFYEILRKVYNYKFKYSEIEELQKLYGLTVSELSIDPRN